MDLYILNQKGFKFEHFIMFMVDKVHISKTMCSFLRHNPEEVGGIDNEGFTSLDNVVEALDKERKEYNVNEETVRDIVEEDDKDRYEVRDGKIRATHGHSEHVDVEIGSGDNIEVPDVLYHGTPEENAEKIMRDGLKPMSRKTVHLTEDKEGALSTGKRHSDDVVLLVVDAKRLQEEGYRLRDAKGGIYVVDNKIPSKFFSIKYNNY